MIQQSSVSTAVAKKLMVLVIVLLALAAFSAAVYASCNTYPNSRISYYAGEYVCAYSGSGCTECTDDSGGSCVTNGTRCEPFTRDPNP